jgi:valyl-tRNA synthetase
LESAIAANERKLADEKFVRNAPKEVVDRTVDSLDQLKTQLAKLDESLTELASVR